jgi:hypothetical protein
MRSAAVTASTVFRSSPRPGSLVARGLFTSVWPHHSIERLGNEGESHLMPAVGALSLVPHLPGVKAQPSLAAGTAEMVERCCLRTPPASQPHEQVAAAGQGDDCPRDKNKRHRFHRLSLRHRRCAPPVCYYRECCPLERLKRVAEFPPLSRSRRLSSSPKWWPGETVQCAPEFCTPWNPAPPLESSSPGRPVRPPAYPRRFCPGSVQQRAFPQYHALAIPANTAPSHPRHLNDTRLEPLAVLDGHSLEMAGDAEASPAPQFHQQARPVG